MTPVPNPARCPFAESCWLGGNYNFCKTANCKEPLLEKDVSRPDYSGGSVVDVVDASGIDYDRMEAAVVEEKMAPVAQGELF